MKSIPKVILHTHLEGSIPSDTLALLSIRNKVSLSFDPFSKTIYDCIEAHNWPTFRKLFFEICSCFNTEQDFHDSVFQYGCKLKQENVVYAEVMFSPWKHLSRGVSLDIIAKGFISAIIQLEVEQGITIKMICDLVRHKDEQCVYIIDWMSELPRNHFVAMGVSGGSTAVDRIHYRGYCELAKKRGFKISAHAGEIEGSESVAEILNYCMADRIGHGIRSIESEELIERLVKEQIHFEICPTANKIIGLCRDNFDAIKAVLEKGINYSINPDDELIFNTNIDKEFFILISEGIINEAEVIELHKNALRNSFADEKTRQTLLNKHFTTN
jgi:adenine deaminase